MKNSKDWLDAVKVIGCILMFTPIIIGLLPIIYTILTGVNVSIDDGVDAAYSAGLMISAGIIAILYVSIKRIKEELLSE